MYIEMKKTGLDVSDLITLVQRKGGGKTGFPYKSFVCRCSNYLYSTKGKCALKECCCMDERIRAHTCTFGEMMRYCFSGIGDNVFHFRLRIAIEREAELKAASWMRDTVNASMKVLPTQERQVKTLLLRSSCFPLMRACGMKPRRFLKETVLFSRLLKSLSRALT